MGSTSSTDKKLYREHQFFSNSEGKISITNRREEAVSLLMKIENSDKPLDVVYLGCLKSCETWRPNEKYKIKSCTVSVFTTDLTPYDERTGITSISVENGHQMVIHDR